MLKIFLLLTFGGRFFNSQLEIWLRFWYNDNVYYVEA